MTAVKHHVIIKGVKNGLIFLLDDKCEFAELLDEMQHKLDKTHEKILTGPIIHVDVKLGRRSITDFEKESIQQIISQKGNLLVRSIDVDQPDQTDAFLGLDKMKVMKGIVRSGQTITHEGNMLFLGDINPGGMIVSTGDIYVMGALRGVAHAGSDGDESKIIAASFLSPTQLRIADVISRPPDESGYMESAMEFAYIKNGNMEIDKMNQISRLKK